MEIKTFGVVGAGQMGSGIAQVAAMSGLDVILNDIEDGFVQSGIGVIDRFLSKAVEKGKLSPEDKDATRKYRLLCLSCFISEMGAVKGT